jgi:hypothetical protein
MDNKLSKQKILNYVKALSTSDRSLPDVAHPTERTCGFGRCGF